MEDTRREMSHVFLARVNRDRATEGLEPVTVSEDVRLVAHPDSNAINAVFTKPSL